MSKNTLSNLTCSVREKTGTIACKKLRAKTSNLAPAILYGENQPNVMLSISQKSLDLLHAKRKLAGHIFDLLIDNKKHPAVVKAVQTHHLSGTITHVDFQRVDSGHKITVSVPIMFENADQSPAIKKKGQITYEITEVEVTCLPKNLPEHIKLDLSQLEIDQIIHRSELNMPKGVTLTEVTDEQHNPAVVTAHLPKVKEESAELESEDKSQKSSDNTEDNGDGESKSG